MSQENTSEGFMSLEDLFLSSEFGKTQPDETEDGGGHVHGRAVTTATPPVGTPVAPTVAETAGHATTTHRRHTAAMAALSGVTAAVVIALGLSGGTGKPGAGNRSASQSTRTNLGPLLPFGNHGGPGPANSSLPGVTAAPAAPGGPGSGPAGTVAAVGGPSAVGAVPALVSAATTDAASGGDVVESPGTSPGPTGSGPTDSGPAPTGPAPTGPGPTDPPPRVQRLRARVPARDRAPARPRGQVNWPLWSPWSEMWWRRRATRCRAWPRRWARPCRPSGCWRPPWVRPATRAEVFPVVRVVRVVRAAGPVAATAGRSTDRPDLISRRPHPTAGCSPGRST